MKNFAGSIVNFLKEEDGPTAVEYAVMLALIVVVCLAAVGTIGTHANATFTKVGTEIAGGAGSIAATCRGLKNDFFAITARIALRSVPAAAIPG